MSATAETGKPLDLTITAPVPEHGVAVHDLVAACPPLDRNSIYANLLQCSHFAPTSAIALRGDEVVGWVSGYIPPAAQATWFLWQVAVAPVARGRGLAQRLIEQGFEIVATSGTAAALTAAGIPCRRVNKVREGRPHIVDMIKNHEISLIVNTTEGKQAIFESRSIRREAVHKKVTYYTTIAAGLATCEAIAHMNEVDVNRLQDLHREIAS